MATREEVKVVLIDTQYVETDPRSFKSVVQSLTGKDSCVKWIEESSFSGSKRKRPVIPSDDGRVKNGSCHYDGAKNVIDGGANDIGDWRLTKGFSFKDLDRMMLPSMEEWQQLWAQ